jgi:hypothetical protein
MSVHHIELLEFNTERICIDSSTSLIMGQHTGISLDEHQHLPGFSLTITKYFELALQ